MSLPIRDTQEGARVVVRIVPRASRTAVLGVHGSGDEAALRIAIQAPPVEGRANAALIDFLAELLHVPRTSVALTGGGHARTKTLLIRGRTAADLAAIFEDAIAAGSNPKG